jgi:hypothetical protein
MAKTMTISTLAVATIVSVAAPAQAAISEAPMIAPRVADAERIQVADDGRYPKRNWWWESNSNSNSNSNSSSIS